MTVTNLSFDCVNTHTAVYLPPVKGSVRVAHEPDKLVKAQPAGILVPVVPRRVPGSSLGKQVQSEVSPQIVTLRRGAYWTIKR